MCVCVCIDIFEHWILCHVCEITLVLQSFITLALLLPTYSIFCSLPEPLSIVVAAGPFSVDDNLTYKPLVELMDKVVSEPPDVLILVG